MKNFRADIVIAVCALLVSGLATGASWWQSRVVAQQLSAQVWPYVSIGLSYSPQSAGVTITNDGLGPAIVQSVVLTIDGRPQRTFLAALRALGVKAPGHTKPTWMSEISPGAVIRVGGSVDFLKVNDPVLTRALVARLDRIDLSACYCSILRNCWIARIQATGEAQPVPRCEDRRRDQYYVPVGKTSIGSPA